MIVNRASCGRRKIRWARRRSLLSLRAAEIERAQRKPTSDLGAYEVYLRALPQFYHLTPEGSQEALGLLGRAVQADPA